MKRNRKIIFLVSGLIVLGFIGYGLLSGGLFAGTPDRELEKRFSDMGITRVSHVTDPLEINLSDPHGQPVNLADFRGKIVFINFWTTWCLACVIEMPSMEKLHQQFKEKAFVMLAINLQESASTVIEFFREYKLTFTALMDTTGDVGAGLGIRAIPTTFILDKEGRLIGKTIGPREWDGRNSIALFEYLIERHAASSN